MGIIKVSTVLSTVTVLTFLLRTRNSCQQAAAVSLERDLLFILFLYQCVIFSETTIPWPKYNFYLREQGVFRTAEEFAQNT